MKREFPIMSLLLIPIGIALNFVIGALAKTLNLPIFLDSVGTILAAVLGGPIVGAITGFLGVLSISAFAPSAVVWSLQAATVGLVVGLLAYFDWFKGLKRIVFSTLIVIGLSIVLSASISYLIFGGFDGYGISLIRAVLVEAGFSLPTSIFITTATAEVIDKTISVALPMIVIGLMSDRTLNKFANGSKLRTLATLSSSPTESSPIANSKRPERDYGSYTDSTPTK